MFYSVGQRDADDLRRLIEMGLSHVTNLSHLGVSDKLGNSYFISGYFQPPKSSFSSSEAWSLIAQLNNNMGTSKVNSADKQVLGSWLSRIREGPAFSRVISCHCKHPRIEPYCVQGVEIVKD